MAVRGFLRARNTENDATLHRVRVWILQLLLQEQAAHSSTLIFVRTILLPTLQI
uniref:Uncharacterized protein n=1 Tax=Arundo donax TaxID=35708 RepID=A0A0A9U643_ARUDO